VPLAMALVPVAVVVVSLEVVSRLGGPDAMRESLGEAGLVGAALLHAFLNLTPMGEILPLSVANGAVFGFALGAAANWTGWMLATLLQYAAARRARGAMPPEASLSRLPPWLRGVPVDHLRFQMLARCVPWVGIQGTNLASGWLRVPLSRFLPGAALGLVGPSLAMAALGSGLLRLVQPG